MFRSWNYQHPEDQDDSGSMIAIATFKGSIYLMDATDACQRFVPFSRAQHVLENGKPPHPHVPAASGCRHLCYLEGQSTTLPCAPGGLHA